MEGRRFGIQGSWMLVEEALRRFHIIGFHTRRHWCPSGRSEECLVEGSGFQVWVGVRLMSCLIPY